MLSHFRAVCAAVVAAATLIIAANTGPARAATGDQPVAAAVRPASQTAGSPDPTSRLFPPLTPK